jgi:hypothetical protein
LSDFEAELFDAGGGEGGLEGGEEAFFFEAEFLHDQRVGSEDFEGTAAEGADLRVLRELRTGGGLPGFVPLAGLANLGVTSLLNYLGDDVLHALGLMAVEAPARKFAAAVEVGQIVGRLAGGGGH